jgi:hypothetical protein
MYDSFEDFLKEAVKQYYGLGWKRRKGTFIALVIGSGQALSIAKDSMASGEGLKKIAMGAAGLVALQLALRVALGGPLGILLTGAAAASLLAYLVQNREEVGKKLDHVRRLIDETRPKFDELQGGYRAGRHSEAERNLMAEGLLKKFLEELDEPKV